MRNPFRRPDLSDCPRLAAAEKTADRNAMRAVFLGTSSVLLRDHETAVLVDGFFSRPGLPRMLLRRIGPDHPVISECLARVGIGTLSAVLCAHSHYDHALDSPVIAEQCGAVLVGSPSTETIGRGYGLPEDQIRVVSDGETLRFGAFEVTMVHSLHSPGDAFPGEVTVPFSPPARASAWRTGTAYSILFDHPAGVVLVHASANYLPGKLVDRRADVVYLGIGGLGKQTPQFRAEYWHEVVRATGPPSHPDPLGRFLAPTAQTPPPAAASLRPHRCGDAVSADSGPRGRSRNRVPGIVGRSRPRPRSGRGPMT